MPVDMDHQLILAACFPDGSVQMFPVGFWKEVRQIQQCAIPGGGMTICHFVAKFMVVRPTDWAVVSAFQPVMI